MALSAQPTILEAANLVCGADGNHNHLRLLDVKLPTIEEQYLDHRPGGAPVAIEVDVIINKFQCDFALAGWSPKIDALVRAWSVGANDFKFFGALRKHPTGEVAQVIANMTGRLGKVSYDSWRRGGLSQTSYSIKGIINYSLVVAGEPLFDWDFFNNTVFTADYTLF
jgi:P2 family phage contractile tail tube protein